MAETKLSGSRARLKASSRIITFSFIESVVKRNNSTRLNNLADSFYSTEGPLRLDLATLFEKILPNLVAEPKFEKYSQKRTFCSLGF